MITLNESKCDRHMNRIRMDFTGKSPVAETGWKGFVFDRDLYDSRRMPKWFFDWLASHAKTEDVFEICGTGSKFRQNSMDGIIQVKWDWSEFLNVMKIAYSPNLVLFDNSDKWTIRMDPDLTVWAGSPEFFDLFISFIGDRGAVLEKQLQEFSFDEMNESLFCQSLFALSQFTGSI